jgi:hypothetical protein
MYGVLNFVESDLNSAVMEELREQLGGAYVDMQEIVVAWIAYRTRSTR